MADCGITRVVECCGHARDLFAIGLAPGGLKRVVEVTPVGRAFEGPVPHTEGQSLKMVSRFDDPLIGGDVDVEGSGDGGRGFLSALERGCDYVDDVGAGRIAFYGISHGVLRGPFVALSVE